MKTQRMRTRKQQRGQVAVLMALSMVGLLAFAVLAIDGGKFYSQRRTAQNAADMSSLAGLYEWQKAATPSTVTDTTVLQKIYSIAQTNYISNPTSNVYAWWVNSNGDFIVLDSSGNPTRTLPKATYDANDPSQPSSALMPNTTATVPNNSSDNTLVAAGVKVRVLIPYQTFIGGIIGQTTLTAQADSVSKLTIVTTTSPDSKDAAYIGGSQCDNITDHIDFNFADVNNTHFMSDVHIEGSLAVGSYNGESKFDGNVYVRTEVGTGSYGSYSYFDYRSNPLTNANHGAFANYTGPTADYRTQQSSVAAADSTSPLSWYYQGSLQKIQAWFFRPDADGGNSDTTDYPAGPIYTWYKNNWQTSDMQNNIFNGATPPGPSDFYHYINAGSADANGTAVSNLIGQGKTGIYFIEGDVNLTDVQTTGISIIATGKVTVTQNQASLGDAGIAAWNISIMAGADLASPSNPGASVSYSAAASRCASDVANAVLTTDGQQFAFSGLMYVPNGCAYFGGNWHDSAENGPIVVNSLIISKDFGHPDNSQGYNFNISKMTFPSPSTGLVQ